MVKQKTKKTGVKKCSHTWHFIKFVKKWDEAIEKDIMSIDEIVKTNIYGRFMCDKCGEIKDTLVKEDEKRDMATEEFKELGMDIVKDDATEIEFLQ